MGLFDQLRAALGLHTRQDELGELVYAVEREARRLNGMQPAGTNATHGGTDLAAILRSTRLLLERAEPRSAQAPSPAPPPPPARNPPEAQRAAVVQPLPTTPSAPKSAPVAPPQPGSAPREPSTVSEGSVSDTVVRQLIALRDDFIDVTRGAGPTPGPDVLAALQRKLDRALEKAGVQAVEDDGRVDYVRHEVIGVQAISDPALHDVICETVRAGYMQGERMLRPQEVIIWRAEG